MTDTRRFDNLPEYAFPRLRALLDRHQPGGDPIAMSIGEPRHPISPILAETLALHSGEYGKYPPNEGTPGWREAVAGWIARRYDVSLDPDTQVLPVAGSREGLFYAGLALAESEKNGKQAAVLMPNPFYQCYAAAALAVGAEPIFVPATADSAWLPDFTSLPEDILNRTTMAYYCSPSNPQGAVADLTTLKGLAALAETYGFTLAVDEPYSEIYRNAPPPGGLQATGDADPDRIIVFNSLSKRSSSAGLRSGFVAGGRKPVAAMKRLRSYAGPQTPLPALHAAEALWRDETHVEENRALYRQKFALADEILGGLPGYASPEAGFFLWIETGDGEASAVRLWQDAGVRVLPGGYLGRSDPRFNGGKNPGDAFIRVALCEPAETIRPGLEAIARHLSNNRKAAE